MKPLLIALALAAIVPSQAFADAAADGPWACTFRNKQTVRNITTGARFKPQIIPVDEQLTAYPNGTFELINQAMPEFIGVGTWKGRGRRAVFTQTNMADAVRYGCAIAGTICRPGSVFSKLVLKENTRGDKMTGTLTGRYLMLVNGLYLRSNIEGKVKCTAR